MRLYIDGIEYQVDGEKALEFVKAFYLRESEKMETIDLQNGKRLDFGKKSIVRLAMKTAMVPFVVPVINLLYRLRGMDPPRHEKHEDLINWMVVKMLEFGMAAEKDVVLHAISTAMEDHGGNIRRIESLLTTGTDILNQRRWRTPALVEPKDQYTEES